MTHKEISNDLSRAISSLEQGGIVEITELPLHNLPKIPYTAKLSGPQFLISDAPEYIPEPEAAVLRENVEPGIVRIYVYNCNGCKGTIRRISTVIKNLSDKPLHYRFLRYGYHPPSQDYLKVAKNSLISFLGSKPHSDVHIVPPYAATPLDQKMEQNTVKFNELVHGFYEIEIDQQAEITVVQTDPSTPSPVASARISRLVPSTHAGAGRGLYQGCDYSITVSKNFVLDTARGAVQLEIANGGIDPWLHGTDSSTTGTVINLGNYGTLYTVRIPYRTSDGKGFAMLTWNPRSQDQWCNWMGNAVIISAGKFPAGLIELPRERLGITHEEPYATILVQVFPPLPRGEQGEIELIYSPPGACCMPTPFIFLPISMEP